MPEISPMKQSSSKAISKQSLLSGHANQGKVDVEDLVAMLECQAFALE